MVVEFFFMTKSQPHRCYLVLSVVLIIIILLSPFNTFTSNDGKVKLLHCLIVQSGVTGLIIGLCWCFMGLRHILGNFGRGQLT